MRRAKYYIYRNLNKGGFSVKYRGKVVAVSDEIIGSEVQFKVSQKGRERCLQRKQRNVHAYAVCEGFANLDIFKVALDRRLIPFTTDGLVEVWYNPYKAGTFISDGKPILNTSQAFFRGGKCYIQK